MPDIVKSGTLYEEFSNQHVGQLEYIPKHLWKRLYEKLKNEVYDAGKVFSIIKHVTVDEDDDEEDESNFTWKVVVIDSNGITTEDPDQVYLIDHAWTYQINYARQHLSQVEGLLDRMVAIMDITTDNKNRDQLIDNVINDMWSYNQTYSLGMSDNVSSLPVWYIMDEFGVKIQHSDQPTVKVVPFYFVPTKTSFSVMWPVENMDEGDELTRDFIGSHITDPAMRKVKLLPWMPDGLEDISIDHIDFTDEFFTAHNIDESLPVLKENQSLCRDRIIRVFTDLEQLRMNLTDERFELINTQEEADVIWLKEHFKDFHSLSLNHPNKIINQFSNEIVLTIKDLMAITAFSSSSETKNTLEHFGPKWLPVTYNLQKELPQLVTYCVQRQASGLDNHWICKPWNMARSLDIHITNNLNQIIRLTESGPKVACKYVNDLVLFKVPEVGDVRFDIRYIVLLTSVQPLVLHTYKIFWLRFANKPFSMDDFDDYEKHFTVMNYKEDTPLRQIHCDVFVHKFENQYPDIKWSSVEVKVYEMIRELFESATSSLPPRGICPCPQSRAMYGVDILLKWDKDLKGERIIQPMICEVNFAPDCERACKYHPFFFNNVLGTLIFGDDTNVVQLV